jgi:hypothetical protein
MGGTPIPMRRPFLYATLAACFAMVAAALLALHASDERELLQVADRIDPAHRLSEREVFEQSNAFAYHELRDPGPAGLPNALVRAYYRFNPLHPSAGDVLRWGVDYRGPCGSSSRVVIELLKARNIPSRALMLLDENGESIHTVVEALVDGRWVVGDPSQGVVFHDAAGQLMTRQQLASDTTTFRANARTVPIYRPEYDYDSVTNFNWRRIPVVLPFLRSVLVGVLGEARVHAFVRPAIWMHPKLAYAYFSIALAIVCAWMAWRTRRVPAGLPAPHLRVARHDAA